MGNEKSSLHIMMLSSRVAGIL